MLYEKMNPNVGETAMINISKAESGCCPETGGKPAMYQIEVDPFEEITAIVFKGQDGEERTAPLTGATTIPLLLEALIGVSEKGYIEGGMGAIMVGENFDQGGIKVTDVEGVARVSIFADFEIIKLVGVNNEFPFEQFTETVTVIPQFIQIDAGDVNAIEVDGVSENLTTGTYAAADGATLQGDIETALDNLGVLYTEVTVTTSGETHTVKLTAAGRASIDGERLAKSGSVFFVYVADDGEVVDEVEDAKGVEELKNTKTPAKKSSAKTAAKKAPAKRTTAKRNSTKKSPAKTAAKSSSKKS